MVKTFSLLVIFFAFSLFAQVTEVKVKTDSSNYLIGDYINLEFTFKHSSEIEILFPTIKDSVKKLEWIEQKNPIVKKENDQISSQYRFTFIGFDSGDVAIPSLLIPYRKKNDTSLSFIRSDSLVITVRTVAIDTTKEIRDVKNPLTVEYDYLTLLYWILGVIAFLLLVFVIYKKFFSKKIAAAEKKIILPDWQIALNELRELEARQLWQNGEVKEYHSRITEIIRNYFESRYDVLALEKTSGEIIDELKKVADAQNILQTTEEFLSNADMVKFAKFIPLPQINSEMMNQALQIIEASRNREKENGDV